VEDAPDLRDLIVNLTSPICPIHTRNTMYRTSSQITIRPARGVLAPVEIMEYIAIAPLSREMN
jgi:hypothetical protein